MSRIYMVVPMESTYCLHCSEANPSLIYQSTPGSVMDTLVSGALASHENKMSRIRHALHVCAHCSQAKAASHQHVYYMVLKVSYLPFKVINSALLTDLQFYSALNKSKASGSEL